MTNKSKFIRILGLVASVIGVGASLISDWVNDKKTEEMVDEKVEAALAKREKKEEERPE